MTATIPGVLNSLHSSAATKAVAYCNTTHKTVTLQSVVAPGAGVSLYDWNAHLEERRRIWRASLLASSPADNPDPPQSLSERMLKGLPTAPDKLQLTNLSSMEEASEASAGIH